MIAPPNLILPVPPYENTCRSGIW